MAGGGEVTDERGNSLRHHNGANQWHGEVEGSTAGSPRCSTWPKEVWWRWNGGAAAVSPVSLKRRCYGAGERAGKGRVDAGQAYSAKALLVKRQGGAGWPGSRARLTAHGGSVDRGERLRGEGERVTGAWREVCGVRGPGGHVSRRLGRAALLGLRAPVNTEVMAMACGRKCWRWGMMSGLHLSAGGEMAATAGLRLCLGRLDEVGRGLSCGLCAWERSGPRGPKG